MGGAALVFALDSGRKGCGAARQVGWSLVTRPQVVWVDAAGAAAGLRDQFQLVRPSRLGGFHVCVQLT